MKNITCIKIKIVTNVILCTNNKRVAHIVNQTITDIINILHNKFESDLIYIVKQCFLNDFPEKTLSSFS